jgi:hypothetical protein
MRLIHFLVLLVIALQIAQIVTTTTMVDQLHVDLINLYNK